MDTLRIATRRSVLAMWQAEHVAAALRAAHPGLEVELVPMTTRGDETLDTTLFKGGGKALFTKELEHAIEDGRADIAVHSMKDVPTALPDGMVIGAILEREDAHDAFVSTRYRAFDELPPGARVGTSSLRRECQLRRNHPHIEVSALRGNVNTRLDKLDAGAYDAIVLAVAGLKRLGLASRVTARIDAEDCLPAIGQGAIGVELREGDERTARLVAALDHPSTRIRVTAERAVNAVLHGSCHAPIAAYATLDGDALSLCARVGMPDGSVMLESRSRSTAAAARDAGERAGRDLLEQGAGDILAGLEAT